MKVLPILFILFAVCRVEAALADRCSFDYWQVIPAEAGCEVFHLPDFDFRQVPHPSGAGEATKRFCTRYEVKSKSDLSYATNCYTGEGDRVGAQFMVDGRKYTADISFEGCVDGREARGIVFLPDGWSRDPMDGWSSGEKGIRRFWPVASLPKRLSCTR